jgi:hypothetical protein
VRFEWYSEFLCGGNLSELGGGDWGLGVGVRSWSSELGVGSWGLEVGGWGRSDKNLWG